MIVSRSAISTGIPAAIGRLHRVPCAPVPASSTSLAGSHPGPAGHQGPGTSRGPVRAPATGRSSPSRNSWPSRRQQRPGGVDTGHDRAGRAGGVGGLERRPAGRRKAALRASTSAPWCRRAAPCARWSPWRPRPPPARAAAGPGESPGAPPRPRRRAAAPRPRARCGVRRPGPRWCRRRRLAEEHRAGVRVPASASRRCPPRRRRAARSRIQLGRHPHRLQPGQHQTEQQRAVQAPGDDHRSWPGRPAASASAWLPWVSRRRRTGTSPRPTAARPAPRPRPAAVGVLDRVQPAVQRRVAGVHRPGQVPPLLVPGHAHRRAAARLGLR